MMFDAYGLIEKLPKIGQGHIIENLFENEFEILFPEIFFIIAITTLLLYGVIYSPMREYKYPILTRTIGWLGIQTLFFVILLIGNQNMYYETMVIINNALIIDTFTNIIKVIVLLSALFSLVISFDYLKGQKINSFEYIVLVLIATLSMLFLISSYDLISLYLAIELQSLSFYVLAAFQRNNEFSTEAGLKYFILGALSSGFLLFGASLVYGFTGITNFEELSKIVTYYTIDNLLEAQPLYTYKWDLIDFDFGIFLSWKSIYIGLLFIIVAFLFKIAAVPFHMWTPDVYEGAPTSVTAFFAITPKIAILAILLRLCLFSFYDLIETWQIIFVFSSILSMYIGTFGAINQTKIKRLFAYSSIAHVGYILIALATATIEAIESLLLYIVIYIIMILNIFSALLVMAKYDLSPNFSNIASNFETMHIPSSEHTRKNEETSSQNPSYLFHNHGNSLKLNLQNMSYIFKNSDILGFSSKTFSFLEASNPLFNRNHSLSHRNSPSLLSHNHSSIPYYKVNSLIRFKEKDRYVKYLTDFSSLSKTNPILAATLAIVFFSNAGVPPLSGFYGKLNVFLAAVESSMYFLALPAIICSVIGAFYSIRLIKILYYHNITTSWLKWTFYKPISKENSFVLAFTSFFTLFFFFYPSFLWTLTHNAALSLCF